MARRTGIAASELMAELESNPEWVKQRDEREQRRAALETEIRHEEQPLVAALAKVGVFVRGVSDLVNTANSYPTAIPVLLEHLQRPYRTTIREFIARALAVREARPLAWTYMLQAAKENSDRDMGDGLFVAISGMARPDDLSTLIDLISDPSMGPQRVFLVANLMRSKRPEARETLLALRNDRDLRNEIAARLKL